MLAEPVEIIAAPPRLRHIMDAAGYAGDPRDFVTQVVREFFAGRKTERCPHMPARFRCCPSAAGFRQALEAARAQFPFPRRILVLGAAPGSPGQGAGYPAETVAEVFPHQGASGLETALVDTIDPSSGPELPGGEFDIAVTHSLFHFCWHPGELWRKIEPRMAARCGVVTGREPNARYWRNSRLNLESTPWSARFRRSVCRLRDSVRRRGSHGLASRFLPEQVRRAVVDPYMAPDNAGERWPGYRGIDWEREMPAWLAGFSLVSVTTDCHLGRQRPAEDDQAACSLEHRLQMEYPLDGSVFSAFWMRDSR